MPTVQSHDDPREMLHYAVSRSASEGMVCEFGVAQGRTINQIASLVPDRRVYGFDSFEGLPEDWYDGEPKGKYRVEALPKALSRRANPWPLPHGPFEAHIAADGGVGVSRLKKTIRNMGIIR